MQKPIDFIVRIHQDDKKIEIILKGGTYPIKDFLKQLGFRWSELDRAWEGKFSARKAIEILAALRDMAELRFSVGPYGPINADEWLMEFRFWAHEWGEVG